MESLQFLPLDISKAQEIRINSFLQQETEQTVQDFYFAKADLNTDGIDEFVLQDKSCTQNSQAVCNHVIISDTNGHIVLLGTTHSKTIMIGGTKTHGIKDILAFENQVNDYDFDIYVWSPAEKTYILRAD